MKNFTKSIQVGNAFGKADLLKFAEETKDRDYINYIKGLTNDATIRARVNWHKTNPKGSKEWNEKFLNKCKAENSKDNSKNKARSKELSKKISDLQKQADQLRAKHKIELEKIEGPLRKLAQEYRDLDHGF